MSALLYPVIITIATLGITVLLIVYVFPKILPIFQSLKAKLPLSTRMVITISNIMRNDGIYIFMGVIIFCVATYLMIKKFPKARFIFHGLILHIPFLFRPH